MDDLGHLYVLANSSMPGLVKIGKTSRAPSDRATELSGVTGLPTPFIVVYEQLFQDCSAAESFVHTYLGQKGFRVSSNREFFTAPVNDVVRAIALAPGAIEHDARQLEPQPPDELLGKSEPDELDSLCLSDTPEQAAPWASTLDEAIAHYYGLGDHLQDYEEAFRLFRQAAALGALDAYVHLGDMHNNGEGVRQDPDRALEFYKEGARKGNSLCYWVMGMMFDNNNNKANAEKCFSLFLKSSPMTRLRSAPLELVRVSQDCLHLLMGQIHYDRPLPSMLSGFIPEIRLSIDVRAKEQIKISREQNSLQLAEYLEKTLQYLNLNQ